MKSIAPFRNLISALVFMSSCQAFAWGELGHRLIAEYGAQMADPKALAACHLTAAQLIDHVNDPDKIWRQQRFQYPHEDQMHFFHVDRQPMNWRNLSAPVDTSQGRLVFHILDYAADTRKSVKDKKWDKVAQRIYGISHYVGDLTQPLHLTHDYDGEEAGLPGVHAQFETKMLNRFEDEARAGVKARLSKEKIPELWSQFDLKHLVFDTAEQSAFKASRLFEGARKAIVVSRSKKQEKLRFDKKKLWQATGDLAMDQIALGARLFAWTINDLCR